MLWKFIKRRKQGKLIIQKDNISYEAELVTILPVRIDQNKIIEFEIYFCKNTIIEIEINGKKLGEILKSVA